MENSTSLKAAGAPIPRCLSLKRHIVHERKQLSHETGWWKGGGWRTPHDVSKQLVQLVISWFMNSPGSEDGGKLSAGVTIEIGFL